MLAGDERSIGRARQLRKAMSLPEVLLWQQLQLRPAGMKFRRQHASAGYVADFYCHEARLVVEVDGRGHAMGDAPVHDLARDAWFADRGIATLRLSAERVLTDIDGCVATIVAVGQRVTPLRRCAPPPLAGEDFVSWNGKA